MTSPFLYDLNNYQRAARNRLAIRGDWSRAMIFQWCPDCCAEFAAPMRVLRCSECQAARAERVVEAFPGPAPRKAA